MTAPPALNAPVTPRVAAIVVPVASAASKTEATARAVEGALARGLAGAATAINRALIVGGTTGTGASGRSAANLAMDARVGMPTTIARAVLAGVVGTVAKGETVGKRIQDAVGAMTLAVGAGMATRGETTARAMIESVGKTETTGVSDNAMTGVGTAEMAGMGNPAMTAGAVQVAVVRTVSNGAPGRIGEGRGVARVGTVVAAGVMTGAASGAVDRVTKGVPTATVMGARALLPARTSVS